VSAVGRPVTPPDSPPHEPTPGAPTDGPRNDSQSIPRSYVSPSSESSAPRPMLFRNRLRLDVAFFDEVNVIVSELRNVLKALDDSQSPVFTPLSPDLHANAAA
jgi:hypothetical protein